MTETSRPKTEPAEAAEADPRLDRAKRRQILEGAKGIFLKHGFDAASMAAIAQEAGVSKGTLYVYFKSKEELFAAIVDDARVKQAERLFAFAAADNVETSLVKLGIGFVTLLSSPESRSSLRTVTAIANRMPELGARFYRTGPAQGIARLREYLETQVAAGVLVPHDTEIAAAQFLDACSSLTFKPLMFNAIASADPALVERVVRMAAATYLRAWRRTS